MIAALPSQLLLVGGYVAGSGALVIALAVLLSAARLLPAVVTLLPYLRARLPLQLFAAHFVAVSVWAESRRHLPPLAAEGRLPFYFGMVTVFNVGCVAATLLGFMLAGRLNIGIGNAQSVAPAYPEKLRGLRRLASTDLRRAARAHLSGGQVKNAGLVTELGHRQQRAATGELHVVGMGCNG